MDALSRVTSAQEAMAQAPTVVVKVGSALLVDDDGSIRRDWMSALVDDLAGLVKAGRRVVLVSSGAIRVGLRLQNREPLNLRLDEKQAAAALGQIRLAEAYADSFAERDINVGQILLTQEDTENRRRYLNARATLTRLLDWGTGPLDNEHDTVATAEIRFGDNDRLAARVGGMVGADLLVLLSDIDGLYTGNPKADAAAEHLPLVTGGITAEIEAMAGDETSAYAKGGMVTKLAAAKIALGAGCAMVIADGR
ncbi:MAG: glutamate 5-kinase, partial [Pseudomonadota bacterium]|nr:glutamate 5-kinase [Pseudomonadota bacterium]